MIYGTAYDETLGYQSRVTVIVNGLSSAARRPESRVTPPLSVVQPQAQALRIGTDNLPIHQSSHQGNSQPPSGLGNGVSTSPQHSYEGLNTPPSVWRTNRARASAKVDALVSNGVDEIEIPAF